MTTGDRPLSPHVSIYRKQITSVLSILHRITGVALSLGGLLFLYWIVAAAYGPQAFGTAQSVIGSPVGRLVLIGFTFSLFYHLLNGIRHLSWDVGLGFELATLRVTGWSVVALAVVLTGLTWLVVLL